MIGERKTQLNYILDNKELAKEFLMIPHDWWVKGAPLDGQVLDQKDVFIYQKGGRSMKTIF